MTRIHGNTMGTTYQVSYVGSGLPQKAIDDLLEEINRSMSTYIESSMISQINVSTDPAIWHPVDDHFETVFRRAREIYKDTNGAFNPAVGPLVNAWGFGPNPVEELPDDATVHALLQVSSFDAFELRDSPPAVRKASADARLDFSAIAKGYAVDAIATFIEEAGSNDYLVEIGGEVRARGRRPDGSGWRVGIEKPSENPLASTTLQMTITLNNAALATSGTHRNVTVENGKSVSHILNPRTGYPADNSLLSVSVLARDTMTADAYATALMVLGLEEALRYVEARESLEAYFITQDEGGNISDRSSSGFPKS
jgi:thiamine biosynthesis lipoprotein